MNGMCGIEGFHPFRVSMGWWRVPGALPLAGECDAVGMKGRRYPNGIKPVSQGLRPWIVNPNKSIILKG